MARTPEALTQAVMALEQEASALIAPLITLFLRTMRRPVFNFVIASFLVFLGRGFLPSLEGLVGQHGERRRAGDCAGGVRL
ncbi:MAG: hypothetical protein HC915_06890 [Anaerolineae bacterium]|nr:hypothetical protein [Anaerolineae bacterium]